ncbi:MAG: restriction endonuclease subunit S, partial [Pirellula sp.]
QKAIAAVLGALDDKIELNRRMNATLESMARALFQSWFVDFDPVRAKLDGRQPTGMDRATADLFPDSFEESALGPIPQGWAVKTIADVTFRVTKGDTPRSEAIQACPKDDRLIPMLRVNTITENGDVLLDKAEMIPESIHLGKSRRSILEENDILYTNAGTIGRVALVQKNLLPANTNQAMAIIRPDPTRVPPVFLYMIMRHSEFQTVLHHDIVHAVQANLALGKISEARAVFPPMATLTRLANPLVEIVNQVFENRKQSRTLATLRDTLLPKLLSGELSVASLES